MAIKVKNTKGVISVLAADTVLLTVVGKFGIEAANLHNTTADDVTVSLYSSPDDTSASGARLSQQILSANEELDINAIVGQGYEDGVRLIAVADVVGVNCSITYTSFTGADI